MAGGISVLVVDDSALMRKLVTLMLSESPGIEVVGQAHDGIEALEMIERLKPQVVTLDVEMPKMDGVTALAEIRRKFSTQVVMLSSVTQAGAATTLKCLELGAFDFVAKPSGAISLDIKSVAADLVSKVKAAAGTTFRKVQPSAPAVVAKRAPRRAGAVLIGCSTGGPRALQVVIPALPHDLGVPVIVVQHMPPSFTATLASRLNDCSSLQVKEAQACDPLTPGQVLVAAGGYHLEFDGLCKAVLSDAPPIHGVRPAVDVTLSSLIRHWGPRLVGVLLTGMGSDGASGMKALKQAGGTTIVEDESTCVVYGMPKAAMDLGVVDRAVPLHGVAQAIVDAVFKESSAARIA